jgi:hypothetical protein
MFAFHGATGRFSSPAGYLARQVSRVGQPWIESPCFIQAAIQRRKTSSVQSGAAKCQEPSLMYAQPLEHPGALTFGLNIAQLLVDLPDHQWPEVFEELRQSRELTKAIGQINQLLHDPSHRDLAVSALRRIGLYLAA